jgi:hypothetical protein
LCHSDDHFFACCLVELPIAGDVAAPLVFGCWCEVTRDDYQALLAFRENEAREPVASFWMAGTLANPVSGIEDSFGTPVMFEVVQRDPTPHVRWVEPGTELALCFEGGVSLTFWHEPASRIRGKPGVLVPGNTP